MLIEKYKNKNVKMLVSSDSGAGITSSAGGGIMTSIITVCGKIVDIDDKFVELSDAQIMKTASYTAMHKDYVNIENFESIMVSYGKIISVAVIEG